MMQGLLNLIRIYSRNLHLIPDLFPRCNDCVLWNISRLIHVSFCYGTKSKTEGKYNGWKFSCCPHVCNTDTIPGVAPIYFLSLQIVIRVSDAQEKRRSYRSFWFSYMRSLSSWGTVKMTW